MLRKTTAIAIIMAITVSAGILGDPEMRADIQSIIDMRFDHRYEEAESFINRLRDEHPMDPAPLFLHGSNLQDWMLHLEDYRRMDEMDAYLDSAINLAMIDEFDPWNLWLIASAYGYRAIAQAEQGKYLQAFRTSSEAMNYYDRAYEFPATRAEASLGIGGYNYWKSSKLGFLKYLPFVPDRRGEGIEYLTEARNDSWYSRDAAIHALVYVFCEEGQLDSARALRDSIAQEYPGSLLPLWYDLAIAEADGNLENYFGVVDELSCALDTLGDEQAVNRIIIHLYAASAAAQLEDWAFVCLHCTAILEDRIPAWAVEISKGEIDNLRGLAVRAAEEGAACPKF